MYCGYGGCYQCYLHIDYATLSQIVGCSSPLMRPKRGIPSYGSPPGGKKVKIEEVTISLARKRFGNIGINIKINLRQAQYRSGQAPKLDRIPPLLLRRYLPLPAKKPFV